ncbi:response regulator [candidate division KSB1 bacterium]|nr:response regulator [candidate division KSB1 bacterium]
MAYNVLIVDDSAVTREIMARSCKLSGVELGEIYKAANGQDALELLKTHWTDIIFADINMPVMDGVQLVENLKQSDEFGQIPVVIVSTEGSCTRLDELYKLGVCGYIRKPFTPEQVAELLRKVLGE